MNLKPDWAKDYVLFCIRLTRLCDCGTPLFQFRASGLDNPAVENSLRALWGRVAENLKL